MITAKQRTGRNTMSMTRGLGWMGALLALAMAGCQGKQEQADKGAGKPPRPATMVSVAPVTTARMERLEQALGTVEAVRHPRISAEVSGQVRVVLAHTGQAVKKGQVLAEIEAQDYALGVQAQRAEVERLKTLLANQGATVARQRQMLASKLLAQSQLDESVAQEKALRQQLAAAEATLARAARSETKTRLVAPWDGWVEEELVANGDFVKVGDPLFRLVSADGLRIRLAFPERLVSELRPGREVVLSSPALPGQQWRRPIREVQPQVSAASKTQEVIVSAADLPLKPGATVQGALVVSVREQALRVPEQAVVLRPAGALVYVLQGDRVQARPVTTGVVQDGWIELLTGVQAGEQVVVDGAGFLTDGASVRVQGATP